MFNFATKLRQAPPQKKVAVFVSGRSFNLVRSRLPLMQELKRRGWTVYALGASQPEFDQVLEENGINYVPIPFFRFGFSVFKDTWAALSLLSLLWRVKPDILHCFNPKPILIGAHVKMFLPNAPKTFCTITGLGQINERQLSGKLVKRAYLSSFKRCDGLFFENSADKDFFQGEYPVQTKATVQVSSGVELTESPFAYIPDTTQPVKFLFASRLLWSKGVGELFEAVEVLAQSMSGRFELWIAGEIEHQHNEGVPESYIARMASLTYVKWLGPVSFKDMPETLSQVDVVVLPSYREGFSKVLMEGAAMGKPLIASNIPGCQEAIKEGINGYLVEPGNSRSLVRVLERVIKGASALPQMGQESRKMAEEHFDQDRLALKALEFYQSCGVVDL